MTISNFNPALSSSILPSASVSFDIDNTYTSMLIKATTATGLELVYDSTAGGTQSGYSVSITGAPVETWTITRDSGWSDITTLIQVTEDETGSPVVTELDYTLVGEATYAEGTRPYNQTAGTGIDHGALLGLGDDDHTQYHNDTRGDVRYPRRLDGAGAPGVSTGNGFDLGTVYVDTTADLPYTLVDATTDANVWSSGGGGGASDLDSVINFVPADNDVTVPSADPVILQADHTTGGYSALTVDHSNVADDQDAIKILSGGVLNKGLRVLGTDENVRYSAQGLWVGSVNGGQNFFFIGEDKTGTDNADNIFIRTGAVVSGSKGVVAVADENASLLWLGSSTAGTDVIIRDHTGSVGAANEVWTSDGTKGSWQASAGGGGPSGYGSWLYDTTTSGAGISNGDIRFDNATITSATEFYISKTNSQATNVGGILDEVAGWRLSAIASDGENVEFLCGRATDNSTYFTIEISEVIGDGTLTNNNEFVLVPLPSVAFPRINQYAWDGSVKETVDVDVTESGGTITLSVQKSGTGDLTAIFAGVEIPWDCTPADTVTLTAGTDTVPVLNYVYATESGGVITLTASTVSFPAEPYVPVATVICQSAASLNTAGPLKVHVWTDHIGASTTNGHLSHINKKLRSLHATWESGCLAGDMTTSSPDAYLSCATGEVLQLHSHTFPALDMATGANAYLVNDPTTAWKKITTLDDVTQDAAGGTINNKHFCLVMWGAVNEDTADCKLFINLPGGTYNNSTDADTDAQGYTDYSIPAEYTGVGFLIAKYNVQGKDSGLWVQNSKTDLRGLIPATAGSGGGGGVGDVTGPGTSVEDSSSVVWDGTTGNVVKEANLKVGAATVGVGTRTLGANAILCGGYLDAGDTITASGTGAVAIGGTSSINGTCTISATGTGSITLAGCLTTAASSFANATNAGTGSLLLGYVQQGLAGTATLNCTGTGTVVQGYAVTGSTIEAVSSADGCFVQGYAASGGVIRATGGDGIFVQGYCDGSGSTLTGSVAGTFVHGYANSGGDILASQLGAIAVGTVFASGSITSSGVGSFAGGYSNGASSGVTASGLGSFAFGSSTGTSVIVASASGAIQFNAGTNNTANSLQVGSGFLATSTGAHRGVMETVTLGVAATTFAVGSTSMEVTGDGGGNTVATITGGLAGQFLALKFVDSNVTITDTAAATADTCNLNGTFNSTANDMLFLFHDGNKWFEISRSAN